MHCKSCVVLLILTWIKHLDVMNFVTHGICMVYDIQITCNNYQKLATTEWINQDSMP